MHQILISRFISQFKLKYDMGLFNFFKRKAESNQDPEKLLLEALDLFLQNKSETEIISDLKARGATEAITNSVVIRASQMNEKYFSEKTNSPIDSLPNKKSINEVYTERLNKTQNETSVLMPHPDVNVYLNTKDGGHGDHFGALLGFDTMQQNRGRQLIQQMMAICLGQPPKLVNQAMKIKEVSFTEAGGNSLQIKIRIILSNENLVSSFPYLETNYVIPFRTKNITEWSHGNSEQAEIDGGGRETFGIGFYATDYAVNKDLYRASPNVNIKLSAFALIVEEYDASSGPEELNNNFTGYLPSKDFEGNSYYDFIGTLLHFKSCNPLKNNEGYILKVKLINQNEDEDFFSVDMFVNNENLHLSKLKIGMAITGNCWFQGEIFNRFDV
ncbi:hypothetical protein G6M26_50205 [Agrobacterium tumefaciens]|nr:hypothetical protein [Agrobacterium tumefaciens]NTE26723.1 hypothetical protein [Agrobacterium tumefaciens]